MSYEPTIYPAQVLSQPGTGAWLEMISVARPMIVATIRNAGGSSADGEVFFQTAIAQSPELPLENAPEDAIEFLTALASTHYQSWLVEHGQEMPADAVTNPEWLPNDEVMRAFRKKVFAWKRLRQLGPLCREKLINNTSDKATCLKSYLGLLFPNASERLAELPLWAHDALFDESGYNNWLICQNTGEAAITPSLSNKRWIRVTFFIALLVTGAWYLYQYFNASVPAEKVFANNFTPPESLVADMHLRYGDSMVGPECQAMFALADEQYRAGNMEMAQEPLLMLAIDSTTTACHSDAWYYLGIVRLTMDDPQTAIECFAKIENLEKFGEDLYWYQGLAFVRLAVGDPSRRDLARRAVERTLANSSNPERKQQAAEMLKDLSE
ncbi:MAG: hypothetical protein IT270_16405 [Saprospiraceae bacterium]|nr:hypothetical protein [Saprospiraceae bacterium]